MQTNVVLVKETGPDLHLVTECCICFPSGHNQDEAPSFTAPLTDRSIEDSSAARFDVRVRGKPAPTVSWYKDGKEISDEQFPHIKVLQEEDLFSILITEGKFEDAGTYKVVAKNVLGEVSSTGMLFVEGV